MVKLKFVYFRIVWGFLFFINKLLKEKSIFLQNLFVFIHLFFLLNLYVQNVNFQFISLVEIRNLFDNLKGLICLFIGLREKFQEKSVLH